MVVTTEVVTNALAAAGTPREHIEVRHNSDQKLFRIVVHRGGISKRPRIDLQVKSGHGQTSRGAREASDG